MAKYLFISTRDPYESRDSSNLLELVTGVRARNHETTLFLIQNGVLPARRGALHGELYQGLVRSGVSVLADAFSLRERAIADLADGVKAAEIDEFVDKLLEPGTKAIWH